MTGCLQVAIAKKEGCKYVSHGSTGKGNDQVDLRGKAHLLPC